MITKKELRIRTLCLEFPIHVARREEMLTHLAMQIIEIRDIWTFGGLEYDRCNAMCLAVTILVGGEDDNG
jgi:hypothetical protein